MSRKMVYEWVVVLSRGESLCLTENQFKFYQDNREEGTVSFRDFEINPSFVVQSFKRPAETLFEKYPCWKCNKSGHLLVVPVDSQKDVSYEECSTCKGTGIDLNYVPPTN